MERRFVISLAVRRATVTDRRYRLAHGCETRRRRKRAGVPVSWVRPWRHAAGIGLSTRTREGLPRASYPRWPDHCRPEGNHAGTPDGRALRLHRCRPICAQWRVVLAGRWRHSRCHLSPPGNSTQSLRAILTTVVFPHGTGLLSAYDDHPNRPLSRDDAVRIFIS